MKHIFRTTSLLALGLPLSLSAAFMPFEDFNSLTAGGLDGQNGWVAGSNYAVSADPMDAGNQVLFADNLSGNEEAERVGIGIADGSSGTVFYRFRFSRGDTGPANLPVHGVSDSTSPAFFNAFEMQTQFSSTDTGSGVYEINYNVRSGGSTNTVTQVTDDTWYNLWLVADTTSDTYDVYLNTGGNAVAGDLLQSGASFRNGSDTTALESFFMLPGGSGTDTPFYIDDIWVDTAGENLMNPVPEPSTYAAIFGVLALGLAVLRRKVRR